MQIRKGPNKVRIYGLLQPFSDAIKLFSKEYIIPKRCNYFIYVASPILALIISLSLWICFPFIIKFLSFDLGILYLLSCLRLRTYPLILSGWASNSNYSLLGGLRSVAQTISYEVCLVFILISFLFLNIRLNLLWFNLYQLNINYIFINLPISLVLFVVFLAETNRSPFDFAEGESELVSGFNVEYRGGGFTLIFLAEYSRILFIRSLFCIVILRGVGFSIWFFLKVLFLSFLYIWARASFPRFRYDLLMYLTWKKYLPVALNYLLLFIRLKILFLLLIKSL